MPIGSGVTTNIPILPRAAVTDRQAVRQLQRLMTWLEAFKECFGRCADARAASICARRAQRQRAQVDGSDVGACHPSRIVQGVSALHHRRAVDCGSRLAAAAGAAAGARRHPDLRRDQLSETRHPFGRRRSPVLRHAREDCQSSGRGDGRTVDVGATE